MPDNSNSKSGAESFGLGIIGALIAAIAVAVLLEGESPTELAGDVRQNVEKQLNGGQTTAAKDAQKLKPFVGTEPAGVVRDLGTDPSTAGTGASGPIMPQGPAPGEIIRAQGATAKAVQDSNPSPTRSTDDDLQPLSSISDEPVTTTAAGDPLSDRDFARAARESLQ